MTAHLLTPETLPAAIAQIAAATRLAIDTEFHTEGRFAPQLLLVQVHVPDADTWLIDPLVPALLPALAPVLLGGASWLVHSGSQDLRLLAAALGGVADVVHDTQVAAGLTGTVYPAGFADLAERWLGERPEKSATMSDWSRRPLTAEQLRYATEDVVVLPAMWDAILVEATRLARVDTVLAACAEARDQALAPVEASGRWRELANATDPSPVEAAVLCALITWRDDQARRSDRPPTYVIGDGTLRQLARGRPTSVDQIASNRRISPKTVERHGRALIQVIQAAIASPPSAWPEPVRRGSGASRVADMLELCCVVAGQSGGFASRLVLPRAVAERVALHPQDTRSALPAWRDALVGDVVRAVISGDLGLRIVGDDLRFDREFSPSTTSDVS